MDTMSSKSARSTPMKGKFSRLAKGASFSNSEISGNSLDAEDSVVNSGPPRRPRFDRLERLGITRRTPRSGFSKKKSRGLIGSLLSTPGIFLLILLWLIAIGNLRASHRTSGSSWWTSLGLGGLVSFVTGTDPAVDASGGARSVAKHSFRETQSDIDLNLIREEEKLSIQRDELKRLSESIIPKDPLSSDQLKKLGLDLGRWVGPFNDVEGHVIGRDGYKHLGAGKRGSECRKGQVFADFVGGRQIVFILHEASMTGAPLAAAELATEMAGCGAKVQAVILNKKGGLLTDLPRRGIAIVKDKGLESWKAATNSDLIIATSAASVAWIRPFLLMHKKDYHKIVWWMMENRREYFDLAKNQMPYVAGLVFISESQAATWRNWSREENLKLPSKQAVVPLAVGEDLARVAGIAEGMDLEPELVETAKAFRKKMRDRVRASLGLHPQDMLLLTLSSVNPGKGQAPLLQSFLKVCSLLDPEVGRQAKAIEFETSLDDHAKLADTGLSGDMKSAGSTVDLQVASASKNDSEDATELGKMVKPAVSEVSDGDTVPTSTVDGVRELKEKTDGEQVVSTSQGNGGEQEVEEQDTALDKPGSGKELGQGGLLLDLEKEALVKTGLLREKAEAQPEETAVSKQVSAGRESVASADILDAAGSKGVAVETAEGTLNLKHRTNETTAFAGELQIRDVEAKVGKGMEVTTGQEGRAENQSVRAVSHDRSEILTARDGEDEEKQEEAEEEQMKEQGKQDGKQVVKKDWREVEKQDQGEGEAEESKQELEEEQQKGRLKEGKDQDEVEEKQDQVEGEAEESKQELKEEQQKGRLKEGKDKDEVEEMQDQGEGEAEESKQELEEEQQKGRLKLGKDKDEVEEKQERGEKEDEDKKLELEKEEQDGKEVVQDKAEESEGEESFSSRKEENTVGDLELIGHIEDPGSQAKVQQPLEVEAIKTLRRIGEGDAVEGTAEVDPKRGSLKGKAKRLKKNLTTGTVTGTASDNAATNFQTALLEQAVEMKEDSSDKQAKQLPLRKKAGSRAHAVSQSVGRDDGVDKGALLATAGDDDSEDAAAKKGQKLPLRKPPVKRGDVQGHENFALAHVENEKDRDSRKLESDGGVYREYPIDTAPHNKTLTHKLGAGEAAKQETIVVEEDEDTASGSQVSARRTVEKRVEGQDVRMLHRSSHLPAVKDVELKGAAAKSTVVDSQDSKGESGNENVSKVTARSKSVVVKGTSQRHRAADDHSIDHQVKKWRAKMKKKADFATSRQLAEVADSADVVTGERLGERVELRTRQRRLLTLSDEAAQGQGILTTESSGEAGDLQQAKSKQPALRRVLLLVGSMNSKSNKAEYVMHLHLMLERQRKYADSVLWVNATLKVAPLYAAADAYVMNAQGIGETFGRVTIEAMAFGLPILGTAAGGTLEIVEDNVSGLLHPVGEKGVPVLAENIMRLYNDPQLGPSLGFSGKNRVRNLYRDGPAYEALVDFFAQVIPGKQPPPSPESQFPGQKGAGLVGDSSEDLSSAATEKRALDLGGVKTGSRALPKLAAEERAGGRRRRSKRKRRSKGASGHLRSGSAREFFKAEGIRSVEKGVVDVNDMEEKLLGMKHGSGGKPEDD